MFTTSRIAAFIPVFFIAALMVYVGCCTPMLTDDYLYVLSYTPEEKFGHLITNLQEWWDSTLALFIHFNARLANPLASLFLYLFGRPAFTALNAFFLVTCLLCLQRLFFKRFGGWSYVVTAAAFLMVMPCPEGTLLWAVGSANYLWTTTLFSLLLLPIFALVSGECLSRPILVLTYIGSFFCSWMHEALGAPISAALFFTFLACKSARTKEVFALTCTFGMGVLPIICSPAAWNRAAASDAGFLLDLGYSCSGLLTYSLFPALITAGALLTVTNCGISLKKITAKLHPSDIFILFLWGSTLLVSMAVGRIGGDGRGYYYHDLTILLMLLRLLSYKTVCGTAKGRFIVPAAACILGFYSYSLVHAAEYARNAHETAYAQACAGNRVCIVDSTYRNSRISDWLPTSSPRSVWFPHSGKFGHVSPYYVITNEFITDKSIYQKFKGLSEQDPHVVQHNHLIIIRLPKGICCDSGRLKAIEKNNGKESLFLSSHSFFRQDWLIGTAKGKTINTLGRDYHDGFHYLICIKKKDVSMQLQVKAFTEDTHQDVEFDLDI